MAATNDDPAQSLSAAEWPAAWRCLTAEELASVGAVLAGKRPQDRQPASGGTREGRGFPGPGSHHKAAIRLLALTGRKPREMLDLLWEDVDRALTGAFSLGRLTVEAAAAVAMNTAAAGVLAGLPRQDVHVFPGGATDSALRNLRRAWRGVLHLACVSDASRAPLNLLRNTYAEVGLEDDVDEWIVAALLGLRTKELWDREGPGRGYYIRRLRHGSERIGSRLVAALDRTSTGVDPAQPQGASGQ